MKRFGATIALLLCLPACGRQASSPEVMSSVRPSPSPSPTIGPVSVRAARRGAALVSIVVMNAGRKLYRIDADTNDSQRLPSGTYLSHFSRPHVVFFQRDGGQIHAVSQVADADGASKIVTMSGSVRLRTQDGTILTCDRMAYDQRTDHVRGDGHVVVMTRQGDVLRGDEIDGDVRLQQVHIGNGGR